MVLEDRPVQLGQPRNRLASVLRDHQRVPGGDEGTREARVDRVIGHHDALRRGLGIDPVDRADLLAKLRAIAPQILPYAKPVWKVLNEARRAGKRILFEGAQGALLVYCLLIGFYAWYMNRLDIAHGVEEEQD